MRRLLGYYPEIQREMREYWPATLVAIFFLTAFASLGFGIDALAEAKVGTWLLALMIFFIGGLAQGCTLDPSTLKIQLIGDACQLFVSGFAIVGGMLVAGGIKYFYDQAHQVFSLDALVAILILLALGYAVFFPIALVTSAFSKPVEH